jgi:5-methylcytosine-specific restriction endonuclease McrA
MTTKYCSKCKTWKPLRDFYKNRSQVDGYQTWCKPCFKQMNAESKQRHKEARNAQAREYAKTFRQTQPEVYKARQKDWYERYGQDYFKEYQNQNRENVQETTRRWRANHPLASQVSGNNTRSKREGATGVITEQEWIAILEKYEHKCAACGEQRKLEIEHITPIKLGGANAIENIQPLCHRCNTRKMQKLTDYRRD